MSSSVIVTLVSFMIHFRATVGLNFRNRSDTVNPPITQYVTLSKYPNTYV